MVPERPQSLNHISLPRYYKIEPDEGRAVRAVDELVRENRCRHLVYLQGKSGASQQLVSFLQQFIPGVQVLSPEVNTHAELQRLQRRLFHGVDCLVAVGGGRVIDIAKMLARATGQPLFVVPTALSHDGICSPIAVLRDGTQNHSLPAQIPSGIVVPLSVVRNAPERITRAGLGDLLSNLTAATDWQIAHQDVSEPVDDFALLLATSAVNSVVGLRHHSIQDPEFLHALAAGLILSGVAMAIAGTSRPCSGAEHKISHALDQLYGGLAAHGEQVALGVLLASYLQGQDWRRLKAMFVGWGLPTTAYELGISAEQVLKAILMAPKTRPNRYTVLEKISLTSEAALEALVETGLIWEPPSELVRDFKG